MKKLLVNLIIIMLLVPLIACAPAATIPTAEATTVADEAKQNERLGTIEAWKVEAQNTLNTLAAKPAADTTVLTTQIAELTTRVIAAETNIATMQAQITALQANPSPSPSPSPSPILTNQITAVTYNISPSSMIYSGGTYDIFVEVKNGFIDAKKIVLSITLTPDNTNSRVAAVTKFSSDSAYITGTGDKMGTSVSSGDCNNITNLIMGTTNQILIAGNSGILIPIKLSLTYCSLPTPSPTAVWSPVWSVTVLP